jgi:23S rRNA pseudouridine1911/1915/1917 synthase
VEIAGGRPRLDAFLVDADLGITRSQLKRLIEEGQVAINGEVATKASRKLADGDQVVVVVPPPAPARAEAEDIPIVVLFEDSHIVAVDKPAGLVVHPAPGHPSGTLVNALLHHAGDLSGVGGELRPGIVHRLDRDTSGVMVASKSDAAHNALVSMFAAHTLERRYLAVVAPPPVPAAATIDTLYGRHKTDRKRFSSKVRDGKRAVTHYRTVERFDGAALVECRLETGRTHQIRVHLTDAGSPLLGDRMYGRGRKRAPDLAALSETIGRQALHAAVLAFDHPITGEPLRFETPPPADMQALLAALRANAKVG